MPLFCTNLFTPFIQCQEEKTTTTSLSFLLMASFYFGGISERASVLEKVKLTIVDSASADHRYYLKQEQLCHHVDCLGDSPDDDGDEEPGHGGGQASRPHDQVQEGRHPDSLGTATRGPCACCSERFRWERGCVSLSLLISDNCPGPAVYEWWEIPGKFRRPVIDQSECDVINMGGGDKLW